MLHRFSVTFTKGSWKRPYEVEVSGSYKEQVTEHGRILQYRPSYK